MKLFKSLIIFLLCTGSLSAHAGGRIPSLSNIHSVCVNAVTGIGEWAHSITTPSDSKLILNTIVQPTKRINAEAARTRTQQNQFALINRWQAENYVSAHQEDQEVRNKDIAYRRARVDALLVLAQVTDNFVVAQDSLILSKYLAVLNLGYTDAQAEELNKMASQTPLDTNAIMTLFDISADMTVLTTDQAKSIRANLINQALGRYERRRNLITHNILPPKPTMEQRLNYLINYKRERSGASDPQPYRLYQVSRLVRYYGQYINSYEFADVLKNVSTDESTVDADFDRVRKEIDSEFFRQDDDEPNRQAILNRFLVILAAEQAQRRSIE